MLTSLDKLATSGPAGACAQPRNVAPKATDLRCTSRSTAASRKGLRNQPPGSKINAPKMVVLNLSINSHLGKACKKGLRRFAKRPEKIHQKSSPNTPIGHLAMTFLSILLMQVDTNAKKSFKLNSTIFDEFDLDFH
jgi:hypothetical protein